MIQKIITGIKSTGSSLHLGNLMGAVLPFQKLAAGKDAAIFVADLHSLTSVKDGHTLREQTFEIAVEYFAIFGIDSPIRIFRQSDIHDITKLMWILTNVTPYSLMNRAHSFKDAENKRINEFDENLKEMKNEIQDYFAKHRNFTESDIDYISALFVRKYLDRISQIPEINMWVFNYPILMAADILGYDVDAVPVGKDQLQHLEMTRDIARAFNKTYGQEIFTEPEAIIAEEVATLPGIDGRKMSKSYDNFIWVFDDEKTMKKRVMSIVSGSEWVDERKKNPDECNIYNLYKVFATPEQAATMREKYNSENIGYGYGHAKTELSGVLQEYLRPYREARDKLLQNPELVEARLAEWARIMNARLDEKMRVVKEIVGVN